MHFIAPLTLRQKRKKDCSANDITEKNGHNEILDCRRVGRLSGNILTPLRLSAAVRVSMCQYNTLDELSALSLR
jgi:hypothetical protein